MRVPHDLRRVRHWRGSRVAVAVGACLGVFACQASLDLDRYAFDGPSRAGEGGSGATTPPRAPGGAGNPAVAPEVSDASAAAEPGPACASPCVLSHAEAACVDAGCVVDRCLGPWRDRNGRAEDGCEAGDVPLAALSLWLMADQGTVAQPDGSVSTWMDQSSNAVAATQPVLAQRPIWQARAGGLPMLFFDGVDDFLALPVGFARFDGASFFAVVEALPNPLCTGILHFSNGPDADDVEFGRHQPNRLYYEVQGEPHEGSAEGFAAGRRLVVSIVQAGSDTGEPVGSVELRIDGARDAAGSGALPATVERSQNYVGRNAYTEQPELCSVYYRGYIGELLFYPRGLTATERDQVEAYLREKWQAG